MWLQYNLWYIKRLIKYLLWVLIFRKEVYEKVCEAFRPVTKEHIAVYGEYNDERLTGKHETASISDFSYGVSDRGASIRIPIMTVERGWKGWLEDRRPASNADPYKVISHIVGTLT